MYIECQMHKCKWASCSEKTCKVHASLRAKDITFSLALEFLNPSMCFAAEMLLSDLWLPVVRTSCITTSEDMTSTWAYPDSLRFIVTNRIIAGSFRLLHQSRWLSFNVQSKMWCSSLVETSKSYALNNWQHIIDESLHRTRVHVHFHLATEA